MAKSMNSSHTLFTCSSQKTPLYSQTSLRSEENLALTAFADERFDQEGKFPGKRIIKHS